MATSERLQIQKIRGEIENEEDYALVLFEDEESYSVVEFDRIQEKSARYNQTVNVVWGKGRSARTYPAKLIFSGSKDECEKESLDLSFGPKTAGSSGSVEVSEKCTTSETSALKRKVQPEEQLQAKKAKDDEDPLYDLHRLNKVVDGSSGKKKQPLQRSFTFSRSSSDSVPDLSYVAERLEVIEEKLDRLLKAKNISSCTYTCNTSSSSRTASPLVFKGKSNCELSDEEDSSVPNLEYNGVDLLNLKAPPKEPTRYATKVVGVLFTQEELLNGMVPPVNEKYGRTPLDSERIVLLKKCITAKYSEKVLNKMWNDIRRAVNQKCNDLRKKQPQPATAPNNE